MVQLGSEPFPDGRPARAWLSRCCHLRQNLPDPAGLVERLFGDPDQLGVELAALLDGGLGRRFAAVAHRPLERRHAFAAWTACGAGTPRVLPPTAWPPAVGQAFRGGSTPARHRKAAG